MNFSYPLIYPGKDPQESSDQEILGRTRLHHRSALEILGKTDERNPMIKSALSLQDEIDEGIQKKKEQEKIKEKENQGKMMRFTIVVRSQNMQKILSFFQKEKSDLSFLDDEDIIHFLYSSVQVYASNRIKYRNSEVPKDAFLREMYAIMQGEYTKRNMTSPIPDFPQKKEPKKKK